MQQNSSSHSKARKLTDFFFNEGDDPCECCGRRILCLTLLTRRLRLHRPLPTKKEHLTFIDLFVLILVPLAALTIAFSSNQISRSSLLIFSYSTGPVELIFSLLFSLLRFLLLTFSYGAVLLPLCVWLFVDGAPLGQVEYAVEALIWALLVYSVLPSRFVGVMLAAVLLSMWMWALLRRSNVRKAVAIMAEGVKESPQNIKSSERLNSNEAAYDKRPLLHFLLSEAKDVSKQNNSGGAVAEDDTKPPKDLQAAYNRLTSSRRIQVADIVVGTSEDSNNFNSFQAKCQSSQEAFEDELSEKGILPPPSLLVTFVVPISFLIVMYINTWILHNSLFGGSEQGSAAIPLETGIVTTYVPLVNSILSFANAVALSATLLWLNSTVMQREFIFDFNTNGNSGYKSEDKVVNQLDTNAFNSKAVQLGKKFSQLVDTLNRKMLQPMLLDIWHGGVLLTPLHVSARLFLLVTIAWNLFMKALGILLLLAEFGHSERQIPILKSKITFIQKCCNWAAVTESSSSSTSPSSKPAKGPKLIADTASHNHSVREELLKEASPMLSSDMMVRLPPYAALIVLSFLILFVGERMLGVPLILFFVVGWCNLRVCLSAYSHFHELAFLSNESRKQETTGSKAGSAPKADNEEGKESKSADSSKTTDRQQRTKKGKRPPVRRVFGHVFEHQGDAHKDAQDDTVPGGLTEKSLVFGDFLAFHVALASAKDAAPKEAREGTLGPGGRGLTIRSSREQLVAEGWRELGNNSGSPQATTTKGTDWHVMRLRLNDAEAAERIALVLEGLFGRFGGPSVRAFLKGSYSHLENFMDTSVVSRATGLLMAVDRMLSDLVTFGGLQRAGSSEEQEPTAPQAIFSSQREASTVAKAVVAISCALVAEAVILGSYSYLFSSPSRAHAPSSPQNSANAQRFSTQHIRELVKNAKPANPGAKQESAKRKRKGSKGSGDKVQDPATLTDVGLSHQQPPSQEIVRHHAAPVFNPVGWTEKARLLFLLVFISYLSNQKLTLAFSLLFLAGFALLDIGLFAASDKPYQIQIRSLEAQNAADDTFIDLFLSYLLPHRLTLLLPNIALFAETFIYFHCTLSLLWELLVILLCNGRRGVFYSSPLQLWRDFVLFPCNAGQPTKVLVSPRFSFTTAILKLLAPSLAKNSIFSSSYPTETEVFDAMINDDFCHVVGGLAGIPPHMRKSIVNGMSYSDAVGEDGPQRKSSGRSGGRRR